MNLFFSYNLNLFFLTLLLYNLSAPSTIALLGAPLSAKHDSYRNKRFLQEGIRAEKRKEAPAGCQWKGQSESSNLRTSFSIFWNHSGIVEQYEKDLKDLKPEEQYIWHLRMEGDIKLVVTAHPTLAAFIHKARFLVCDYTFKRTSGDLNEWEVVIWRGATNERKPNSSIL